MTNHEVEALCVRLKSGEYDGSDLMSAWITLRAQADEIERLEALVKRYADSMQTAAEMRASDEPK